MQLAQSWRGVAVDPARHSTAHPHGMAQNGNPGDEPPAAQPPAGLSLSFSGIKGRTKPKLNISEAEEKRRREAITGIGSAGVVTADGKPTAAGPRVIPKQEDSFVVGVGRKSEAGGKPDDKKKPPCFLPDRDDGTVGTVEDKFEVRER